MPDFLNSLEDYVPTVCTKYVTPSSDRVPCQVQTSSLRLLMALLQIPDEFTEYFLERSGFDCKDIRLCALFLYSHNSAIGPCPPQHALPAHSPAALH